MMWQRINRYTERSDQGHKVCALKAADGWRYAAWTPPDEPDLKYWDWHDLYARVHYKRGQAVPQRSQSLGIYETAAEARAACEQHAAAEAA
jgi:hypothetical protein